MLAVNTELWLWSFGRASVGNRKFFLCRVSLAHRPYHPVQLLLLVNLLFYAKVYLLEIHDLLDNAARIEEIKQRVKSEIAMNNAQQLMNVRNIN